MDNKNKININEILKESYSPELPFMFAENLANKIINQSRKVSIWDLITNLQPKINLAFGAVAILIVFTNYYFGGISTIADNYSFINSFIPTL